MDPCQLLESESQQVKLRSIPSTESDPIPIREFELKDSPLGIITEDGQSLDLFESPLPNLQAKQGSFAQSKLL